MIIVLTLACGLLASWLISRSLARPIRELTGAMAVVGSGRLDHPINVTSRDEIGELARAFGRMTDSLRQNVTKLERTQSQLVQSEKLASIGEMAAAVAHGLRNPLASLRAAAQLVRRHPDSPSSAEHLDAIVEEVDRLDRRISHLLSFSRPAPFRPMPERLDRLVEDLLPAFAEPLRERDVELTGGPPSVAPRGAGRSDAGGAGDAGAGLQRARRDAERRGSPRRGARRRRRGDRRRRSCVEVADTGGGIPEHVLPSVCEPFFTTRREGTGLGLAIAKRYVEQNGGRLAIVSRRARARRCGSRLPAGGTA